MKINTITTYWREGTRIVFVTEDCHGIVEIQYPKESPELGYIWHLWVDPGFRQRGYATALLDAAEAHIKKYKCKYAVLDWDRRDSERETLEWYRRRGYSETEFGKFRVRLQKDMKPQSAAGKT